MIKLVAILMACMALTACGVKQAIPTQADHAIMAKIGCENLGMPLKEVSVYKVALETWIYRVFISCGDGTVRIEVDLPINPPKQLKEV